MTRRSKPDGDCCWPVGAGEGHDPGTDTVLDASRRDRTGGRRCGSARWKGWESSLRRQNAATELDELS
jgi:hypothetical protein